MKWGTFGTVHLITIGAAVLMLLGLYFALRKQSQRVQTLVLGILSFSGVAAIIYNLVTWGEPLAYLPLHLCSVNALILPVAVFTRNKTMGNLLLVWSLGALMAIILNWEMAEAELFDMPFNFYYFPHVLEFGIPILLFRFRLIEKDPRCIGSTLGITLATYTLAHFANLIINTYTDVTVNYMFSVDPSANPVIALFYKIIPHSYWYMYLVLPIVALYLLIVYLPQLRVREKKKKLVKAVA